MHPSRTNPGKTVQRLDKWRDNGGVVDLTLQQNGKDAYERNIREILTKYPDIGKATSLTSKVVLVGDSAVGKTSLMMRYTENKFHENEQATVGVDFSWQRYLKNEVGLTIHLWDTAGQERFRSMTQSYYRGAHACIAAFDLSDQEGSSLDHCEHWVAEVKHENKETNKELCVFLVGCKSDKQRSGGIEEKIKEKAARMNAEYFEVSSKLESDKGNGVNEMFERVALVLFERAIEMEARSNPDHVPQTPQISLDRAFTEAITPSCCG